MVDTIIIIDYGDKNIKKLLQKIRKLNYYCLVQPESFMNILVNPYKIERFEEESSLLIKGIILTVI